MQDQYEFSSSNMAAQRSVLSVGIPLVAGLYVIHVFFGKIQFSASRQGVVKYLSHISILFSLYRKNLH